jgi:hypothetical protein
MSKTADIASFFGAAPAKKEVLTVSEPAPKKELEDPFYATLTPKQRLAHTIAAKMLGTSYDVKRTRDFIASSK